MAYKIGVVDEVGNPSLSLEAPKEELYGYTGGKTVANFDPHPSVHSEEQVKDALRQTAALMHEAGLTDPFVDGTAGDEGTNRFIGEYVEELADLGHPHPETVITGKSDMRTRAEATGRGGAIVHRSHMQHIGVGRSVSAVQGAGFAGAYYAAEAFDPIVEADKELQIAVPALGDLDSKTRQNAVLCTDAPEGLAITHDMVDSVLNHPDQDPDMQHEKVAGDKLKAFARKLERSGQDVSIVARDVLLFDNGADVLVPAATSKVITPHNIGQIVTPTWLEIGNNTVHPLVAGEVSQRGFTKIPGKLANAGGVKSSTDENKRDLGLVRAETGGLYLPVSDDTYRERLYSTMNTASRKVHSFHEKFGLSFEAAADAVSLAHYALAREMTVDASVRDLINA
jgi:glutamate dehydrogenase/leucine dehydrogenase